MGKWQETGTHTQSEYVSWVTQARALLAAWQSFRTHFPCASSPLPAGSSAMQPLALTSPWQGPGVLCRRLLLPPSRHLVVAQQLRRLPALAEGVGCCEPVLAAYALSSAANPSARGMRQKTTRCQAKQPGRPRQAQHTQREWTMGQLTWIGSLPNTSPNSEKTPNAATAIWTLEKAGRPAPPALIDGPASPQNPATARCRPVLARTRRWKRRG